MDGDCPHSGPGLTFTSMQPAAIVTGHRARMADIDTAIDLLFQGPLDAFTDARNALAKSAKRPDVKALAKPSLPAWAVNQLFWHHRPVIEHLEAASEAVRREHQRALAGEPADIARADQAHREALRDAAAAAKEVLIAGGHAMTPGTLDAIRDTLQALPSPEAIGRLTRPLAPRGLEALAGLVFAARLPGPAAAPPAAPRPTAAATPPTAKPGEAAATEAARARAAREREKAAEKAAKEREAARQKAEAALAEAREALAAADAAVEQSERDLATRQAARVAARDAVKKAQRAVEELSFGR